MNINLALQHLEIEASREVLEKALQQDEPETKLHHEPILVHQYPVEMAGVYEVWFASNQGTFVHVTPDGHIVQQYSITPEIYFPEGE